LTTNKVFSVKAIQTNFFINGCCPEVLLHGAVSGVFVDVLAAINWG